MYVCMYVYIQLKELVRELFSSKSRYQITFLSFFLSSFRNSGLQ
jgi:hypothetical protein